MIIILSRVVSVFILLIPCLIAILIGICLISSVLVIFLDTVHIVGWRSMDVASVVYFWPRELTLKEECLDKNIFL